MSLPQICRWRALLCALALACAASPALAEKADRSKPWVVEADRDGVIDLQRQVLVYTGNVVITQGTMVLRAERVEMRELPDGYRAASALGQPGKPASQSCSRAAPAAAAAGPTVRACRRRTSGAMPACCSSSAWPISQASMPSG